MEWDKTVVNMLAWQYMTTMITHGNNFKMRGRDARCNYAPIWPATWLHFVHEVAVPISQSPQHSWWSLVLANLVPRPHPFGPGFGSGTETRYWLKHTLYSRWLCATSRVASLRKTLYSRWLCVTSRVASPRKTLYSRWLCVTSRVASLRKMLYSRWLCVTSRVASFRKMWLIDYSCLYCFVYDSRVQY